MSLHKNMVLKSRVWFIFGDSMNGVGNYVCKDGHGVLRVGDTRVMLDSIIASFERGQSAEVIQEQYPSLTLEQVYGAIAWYLAHQDEAQVYMEKQGRLWREQRGKAEVHGGAVLQRLRAAKKQASLTT